MPLAITNCLNFGNPYKPEVYYQFKEACAGMGEACRLFETPVTGGNVSFYNENPVGAVYPTPVIGMIGLIEDIDHITQACFREAGDRIILLGTNRNEINATEYLSTWHGIVGGDAPYLDLEEEHRLHGLLLEAIRKGLVRSAHDVSDGGLAVTLAESCFIGDHNIGATVEIGHDGIRKDALYFGESQSRVVISCAAEHVDAVMALASAAGIAATDIGVTGGERLRINTDIDVEVALISEAHSTSLSKLLEKA
jgi:phosphoribosylformylglycinamidine synthase